MMKLRTRTYHVHYIDADDAEIIARFPEQGDAWRFMRLAESQAVMVGYPVPDDWTCTSCRFPIR